MILPIQEPADGFTTYERYFLKQEVINIYKTIDDPYDKLILALLEESNWTQEDVAELMNVSQEAICKRLKQIKQELRSMRQEGKL